MSISHKTQRILFSDNGTVEDLTHDLNDFRTGSKTLDFTTGEDYIYIGSELPFNHKFFEIDSGFPNSNSTSVSVDIWWSNSWVSAVDIVDKTADSGTSFGQSGDIRWNTDRLKGWDREQDSADVSGLSGTAIYNLYWVRLSWDANFSANVKLDHIGHKFCNDDILESYYPDLRNQTLKTAFEDSNKTTWNEQHFVAAKVLTERLVSKSVIDSPAQLLDPEVFSEPAAHLAAAVIYGGLGTKYLDLSKEANKRFEAAIDQRIFRIDRDRDGRLENNERFVGAGRLMRS